MSAKERFYVTTPIYYPSDNLHIGHAYTTTVADSLARWHRFAGREVYFVTGSDEHGQKIQRAAAAKGVTPKEYVDVIVASFKDLWEKLNITYDDFVRTTDDRHTKAVQAVFQKIYEKGDIYKSAYEGWYCTPCRNLLAGEPPGRWKCRTVTARWNGLRRKATSSACPSMPTACSSTLRSILSSSSRDQAERDGELHQERPGGSLHLRTTFDWGIPVPSDERHVVYVWFDALTNYLTALGYPEQTELLDRFWPADLHLVGKEIMRFHTIVWPIMLMALDLPLPKTVFGHGWLLFDSDKMSKSKGNVVDPIALMAEFGVDPIRYFLLREISFGQDGNFSRRALIERTNADLANDLGNLLNRTLSMLNRYCAGVVPQPAGELKEIDQDLISYASGLAEKVDGLIKELKINEALASIWRLVGRANKYVDERAPWNLAKLEDKGELGTVIYNLVEPCVVKNLVQSFIPETGPRSGLSLGWKAWKAAL